MSQIFSNLTLFFDKLKSYFPISSEVVKIFLFKWTCIYIYLDFRSYINFFQIAFVLDYI